MPVRNRRSFLVGLLSAAASVAAVGVAPPAAEDDLLVPAQYLGPGPGYGPGPGRGPGYGPGPGRGRYPPRRRRCWTERRRVFFRDRFGRPREQIVWQKVCR